jgi:hypothetical protein
VTGLGQLDGVVFSTLILGLTVLSVIEHLVRGQRRRRAPQTSGEHRTMAGAGFDTLSVLFSPAYRHKLELDEEREVHRDQPGEDAPPRSHIDLDAGIARLVLPRRP